MSVHFQIPSGTLGAFTTTHATNIHSAVLGASYNKYVRPSEVTNINIEFVLFSLNGLVSIFPLLNSLTDKKKYIMLQIHVIANICFNIKELNVYIIHMNVAAMFFKIEGGGAKLKIKVRTCNTLLSNRKGIRQINPLKENSLLNLSNDQFLCSFPSNDYYFR